MRARPHCTPGPRGWSLKNPLDDYLASRARFLVADRRIGALARLVSRAAELLARPGLLAVANVTERFPGDAGRDGAIIDAATWPSGEELGTALAAWHRAYREMHATWRAVPDAHKAGLPEPL